MGGEPWTFTPTEIGKLTDAQIWDQYIKPAIDRQRGTRRRRRRKGEYDDGIPDKETYVLLGLHAGLTREKLEADYDTWAASEEGQAIFAKRAERAAAKAARQRQGASA